MSNNHPVNQFQFLPESNAFDTEAISDLITAHGIPFIHYRGMPNPKGMIDRFDNRRPDASAADAINGMYYTRAGAIKCLFVGNSKEVKQSEGIIDAGVASVTPDVYYCHDENQTPEEAFFAPFDRIYLAQENILVTKSELVEHSITGIDSPKYPPVKIQDVVDAHGKVYSQGDFAINSEGRIVWGPNKPSINIETGKGVIYAIRYLYRPYWYVDRMVHDIRVAQTTDEATAEKEMKRLPQQFIAKREYVYESEQSDSISRKHQQKPEDGSLPPR